jgi:DNA polymerase-1
MVSYEFAKGDKTLGIIIGQKYYNFKQFIGNHFGIPLKKYDPNIANKLLTISTFELDTGKKLKKSELKPHIDDIIESCHTIGITTLLVANSDYFKYMTGEKLEESIGSIFSYQDITVLPCINPVVLNAQPNKQQLLNKAIAVCGQIISGTYEKPKEHEFESYQLVQDVETANRLFANLQDKPIVAIDIECTGLRVGEAEILTIAFAWDKFNAFTVACHKTYGVDEQGMIDAIKHFFKSYKGRTLYHNSLFDLKHLTFAWWMDNFSDTDGLYQGLSDLGINRVDDSMLLAYSALNSTDRPQLGLKVLAKEFLGNWSEDVTDCLSVELEDLAYYNAKDVVGTIYVYEKFADEVDSRIYTEILQPSLKPLLHMMINGLPIDMEEVDKAYELIGIELDKANKALEDDEFVQETEFILQHLACEKYNNTHVGNKEPWQFTVKFNPNSSNQLRILLFDVMGFEPIEFTDTGVGKTDRASIKEFLSQLPDDDPKRNTLNALKAISETAIIQNTFIAAFKELSIVESNGATLHGNLRLGGTQSGRLSSSEP